MMDVRSVFVVLITTLILYPAALPAQRTAELRPGTRVRVRPGGETPWMTGTVVWSSAGRVGVARPLGDTIAFDLDTIARLDMSLGRESFDGGGALKGAGAGLLGGVIIALITDAGGGEVDGKRVAIGAGIGTVLGAGVGGGGQRAQNGALFGALGGAATGAIVALAAYDDDSGTSRGDATADGALLGALIGGGAGLFIGAAIPRERWVRIWPDEFGWSMGPAPGGGVRVSVRVGL